MRRYFFHLCEQERSAIDHEGTDLPNDESARAHAIAGIRSILAEDLRDGGTINLMGTIDVLTTDGVVRFVVEFGDAVTIEGYRARVSGVGPDASGRKRI